MTLPDGLLEVNGRIWLASFLGHDQVLMLTATRKEGDGTRDSGADKAGIGAHSRFVAKLAARLCLRRRLLTVPTHGARRRLRSPVDASFTPHQRQRVQPPL